MNKKIIEDAALVCENVVKAINQRNRGNLNCHSYCPGEDALVNVLNKLTIEIKDVEPECYIRLNKELKNLRTPNCVNPFSCSLAFHIMYSAYKLNKQDDNIQA